MSGELSDSDTVLASSGNYSLIGKVIGNYKVTDVLGQGGFGAVYKAEDTKLGRTVALKFLRQADHEFHAELFEREARALGALSKHNNIVQIHAWDEYKGANFFVLEFMSSSVADEIKKYPDGMPINKAVRIIAECADALAFAHEAEILHRDIKAQNILLEELDGTAKIADFGLARICGPSNHTIEGQAIGSPVYMAPEQARGQQLTHLCDIYSLGVTLYELLSGKPSVSGSSILEVLEKVRNNDRIPLRSQKPGLPDALYAIVDRATAPEPANRYQSAVDMALDLRAIDTSEAEIPLPIPVTVEAAPITQTLAPLSTPVVPSVVAPPPKVAPKAAPAPAKEADSTSSGSLMLKIVGAAAVILLAAGVGYGVFAFNARSIPEQPGSGVAEEVPPPVASPVSEPTIAEQPPEPEPSSLEPAFAETEGDSELAEQVGDDGLETEEPVLRSATGHIIVRRDTLVGEADADTEETMPAAEVAGNEATVGNLPGRDAVAPSTKAEEPVATPAVKKETPKPQPKPEPKAEPAKTVAKEPTPKTETTTKPAAVPATEPAKSTTPTSSSTAGAEEKEAVVSVAESTPPTSAPVETQPASSTPSDSSSPSADTFDARRGKATIIVGGSTGTSSTDGTTMPADTQPVNTTSSSSSSTSEDTTRRGKATIIVRSGSSTDTSGTEQPASTEPVPPQPVESSTSDSSSSSSSSDASVVRRGKGTIIKDN